MVNSSRLTQPISSLGVAWLVGCRKHPTTRITSRYHEVVGAQARKQLIVESQSACSQQAKLFFLELELVQEAAVNSS